MPLVIFASAFGMAAGVSMLLTLCVRRFAPRVGAIAIPKADRWHRKAVPLLGGVAVWGGLTAALVQRLDLALSTDILGIYGVATCLFVVGLVDDFVTLKPSTKLTAQIAAACMAVLVFRDPGWAGLPVAVNVLLAIVWIVGITNAFNLLDNMDGVCAGVAVIAAGSYALTVGADFPNGVLYAGGLAGAAAGFLLFNFQPATIFLGDSGSLFIGASFGILSLAHGGTGQKQIGPAVAVPLLVLLLPIFDTILVTLTRKLAERSASVGGRDHTSHRLVALGFSERQTVLLLYTLAAAGGSAAAALRYQAPLGVAFALLVLVALVLLGVSLSSVRVYEGKDFALLRNRRYTPLLLDMTYKRRIFEILLDVGLISIAYFLAYVLRFDEQFEPNRRLFEQSLPIIIGCQMAGSFVSGLYRGVWRYIGLTDLWSYAKAVVVGTVASLLTVLYLYRFEGYSRGVFAIYAMTVAFLLVGSRVSFRLLGEVGSRSRSSQRRALIYGAGDAGVLLVRELVNNGKRGIVAIGFVDDDPAKSRRRILGVKVLGTGPELEALVARYKPEVLILSTRKVPQSGLDAARRIAAAANVQCLQFEFRLSVIVPPVAVQAASRSGR
jgi:UDP-GlcNAc:undecaprenyl-phosphate GlcNAc-1-phosphate transferase